jgi:hypothetical protein
MGQGRSPAEGVPFLGTKKTPEALIYPRLSVSCFNPAFIDAGEGIATALPHDERSPHFRFGTNGPVGPVWRCPLSVQERKTSARSEYFRF